MPKISVIIPCYNVENYIDFCMESVVNQTIGIEHLEIILVNDASTDTTLEKLKQWESKFPDNILVITYDENIRQGGARNVGMTYASGEYICFCDADDWIEPDMYEILYEKMSTGKYDMVKCKFVRELYPGEERPYPENREDMEYDFSKESGKKEVYYGSPKRVGNCGEYGSLCTGIYKTAMLKEKQIYFPEGMAYEDNYWGSILTLYIEKLYIVDKILYHYLVNPFSTTTKINAEYHFDRLDIEIMKVEELKKRGAFQSYYREIERDFLQLFYLNTWHIIFTRFTYIPDIFAIMKRKIEELFPTYYENPYLNDMGFREKELMRMLTMKHDFTVEELENIKRLYLNTM